MLASLAAVFVPDISHYKHGPLNAAGVRTPSFIGAAILAMISVYPFTALGVRRMHFLPPHHRRSRGLGAFPIVDRVALLRFDIR